MILSSSTRRRPVEMPRFGMYSQNDEICIQNDEVCIQNDEICIQNDEICIQNDEICSKTMDFVVNLMNFGRLSSSRNTGAKTGACAYSPVN